MANKNIKKLCYIINNAINEAFDFNTVDNNEKSDNLSQLLVYEYINKHYSLLAQLIKKENFQYIEINNRYFYIFIDKGDSLSNSIQRALTLYKIMEKNLHYENGSIKTLKDLNDNDINNICDTIYDIICKKIIKQNYILCDVKKIIYYTNDIISLYKLYQPSQIFYVFELNINNTKNDNDNNTDINSYMHNLIAQHFKSGIIESAQWEYENNNISCIIPNTKLKTIHSCEICNNRFICYDYKIYDSLNLQLLGKSIQNEYDNICATYVLTNKQKDFQFYDILIEENNKIALKLKSNQKLILENNILKNVIDIMLSNFKLVDNNSKNNFTKPNNQILIPIKAYQTFYNGKLPFNGKNTWYILCDIEITVTKEIQNSIKAITHKN